MIPRLLGAAAILILFSSTAWAIALEEGLIIPPDAVRFRTAGDPAEPYVLRVHMEKNKSYVCTMYAPNENYYYVFEEKALVGSNQVDGRLVGNITPVNTAGSFGHIRQSRLSLIPTEDGVHQITTALTKTGTASSYVYGSIACVESTIYGGFNTNVNEYNFLELTNTTNRTVNVKIRVVAYDGTVLIDNSAVTLASGVRTDIDLHSLVGQGKYGSVVVMHDGPFGAIKGAVSQYKAQPNGSFSSAQSSALKPRSNVSVDTGNW